MAYAKSAMEQVAFFIIDKLTVYRIENQFKVLVYEKIFFMLIHAVNLPNTPNNRVPLIPFANARTIIE